LEGQKANEEKKAGGTRTPPNPTRLRHLKRNNRRSVAPRKKTQGGWDDKKEGEKKGNKNRLKNEGKGEQPGGKQKLRGQWGHAREGKRKRGGGVATKE